MKPLVPPIVVALACRTRRKLSIADQARSIQWVERNLYKRITNGCCDWSTWVVEDAVKWCSFCGYDFYNLGGELLTHVEWTITKPLHRRALEITLAEADAKLKRKTRITDKRLSEWAKTLNKLHNGHV